MLLRPVSTLRSVRAWVLKSSRPCWLAGAMLALTAAGAAGAAAAADASAGAAGARAAGSTALERYLNGLKSLRTAFTQTVTDAHGTLAEAGSRHAGGAAARKVSLGVSTAHRCRCGRCRCGGEERDGRER